MSAEEIPLQDAEKPPRRKISALKILDGYRIHLRFADGVEGDIDFSPLVGQGVLSAWKNEAFFRRAFISSNGRVLEWPGEIDFCADALYLRVTGKGPEEVFSNLHGMSSHA